MISVGYRDFLFRGLLYKTSIPGCLIMCIVCLQAPQFVGSSAFPDSAIAPQASPSGSLPPTSQDQWLGILHSLVSLMRL